MWAQRLWPEPEPRPPTKQFWEALTAFCVLLLAW